MVSRLECTGVHFVQVSVLVSRPKKGLDNNTVYRLRFGQNRYPVFFSIGAYAKLYSHSNLGVRVRVREKVRVMSGLTLPAAVVTRRDSMTGSGVPPPVAH